MPDAVTRAASAPSSSASAASSAACVGFEYATVGVTRTLELEQLGELDGIGDLERARLIDRHIDRRLRCVGSTAGGTNGTRGEARHGW